MSMQYYETVQRKKDIAVKGVEHFSLEEILNCGQAFRWRRDLDGVWRGIVAGRLGRVSQSESELVFHQTDMETFQTLWAPYFDLDRDYGAIKQVFSKTPALDKAVAFCPGMRILRQEPWEALCSFILSQNNNIKRITGLVDRLCQTFGDPVEGGFAFPSPERLAALEVEDLAPVRAGFRSKYVLDAARRVSDGRLDLRAVAALPADEARAALTTVYGVGVKVADCAMLYGLQRLDCVPADVWIKRVMKSLFPDGFPEEILPVAGIAQQYLFHYARHNPLEVCAVG